MFGVGNVKFKNDILENIFAIKFISFIASSTTHINILVSGGKSKYIGNIIIPITIIPPAKLIENILEIILQSDEYLL